MYLAKEERFVPYGSFKRVFPRGPPVACKYFDIDVQYEQIASMSDFTKIETPAFDQIMASQEISELVRNWFLAIGYGRMLYDVGELDDYQVNLFVKGFAGTGKSKLLESIAEMYDEEDVGLLPNNIEEKFGLSVIANRFIAIADDVRRTLKLDQSDFQNMSSANRVSCPRKHKDPLLIQKWHCGVTWAGNEIPDFSDNAGSFSRRLFVVYFPRVIKQVDMTLGARLMNEIPLLIIKGNWAYRNLLRQYGNRGIWDIAPQEFKEQRSQLAASSNSLMNLFASGTLVFSKDAYITLSRLRDFLTEHCKKTGFSQPRWNADFYNGPIASCGLVVETHNWEWPRNQVTLPKKRVHTAYVVGCELPQPTGVTQQQTQPQQPQQPAVVS
jgi:hypothetical protein